jgi:hypothetical protein
MAMSEHEKIRELLALAAAGALTIAEEKQVAEHVRSCIACSNELEAWRPIATDLSRLPMPQLSSWLVQATLARAEAKFAELPENDWNRRMMIFVVAFAWLLTCANWLVLHIVIQHFGSSLGPEFGRMSISFAAFTALGWLAGAMAAVMLAIPLRGERRLV